jgi:DNA binding protein with HTH domain
VYPSADIEKRGVGVRLQTNRRDATLSNVDAAARLRRLLVILSAATVRPGIRAAELAATLKVSERTVFRDLAELQRLGFPVSFGNGYPAQQELFRRRRRQELSQVMADLVDQQLEVVRRKLPPEQAEVLMAEATRYLPMEAAEAVTRALARAGGPPSRITRSRSASSAG